MFKVKPSRYNLVVETQADGTILLFNTFSNALCLLSREKQESLRGGTYTADELSPDDRETIEQFLSMGFLVDQDVDELQLLELKQDLVRYGNRHLSLTIGVTMDCNMCCPYCFETEGHQTMTSETAEKLVHFLKNYIEQNKIESVRITWYGGEPLLELERIEQISNELIPFCAERAIPYSANITTNGYLLDRESAESLTSLKVGYAQITIDGLEGTHNARRRLKNGQGSFWPIVKNIESVKDILRIIIRVNVDKTNADEMDGLMDFFINDMKWGNDPALYLAAVDSCTEACGADLQACLSPEEFSVLHQQITAKMFEQGITEIAHQNYPSYSNVGCAAICINNFVIDANGYFYTCWNSFGDASRSIGSLDRPEKIGLRGDYLHWMTVPTPEPCKGCVYLPICRSGCPDRRIKAQNRPTCSFAPSRYIGNLKLAFRAHIAKK